MDFQMSSAPSFNAAGDEYDGIYTFYYPVYFVHVLFVAAIVGISFRGITFSRSLPTQTVQGVSPRVTKWGSYFITIWTILWLIKSIIAVVAVFGDPWSGLSQFLGRASLVFGIINTAAAFLILTFQIALTDIIGRSPNQGTTVISKPALGLILLLSPVFLINLLSIVFTELVLTNPDKWLDLLSSVSVLSHLYGWIFLFTAIVSLVWIVRSRPSLGAFYKQLVVVGSLTLFRHFTQVLFFTLIVLGVGGHIRIDPYPVLALVYYGIYPVLTGLTATLGWNKLLVTFRRLSDESGENAPAADDVRRPLLDNAQ